jgi:hypothetical protein
LDALYIDCHSALKTLLAMLIGSVQVLLHGGTAPTPDLLVATYVIALVAAAAGITMARRIGNKLIYAL